LRRSPSEIASEITEIGTRKDGQPDLPPPLCRRDARSANSELFRLDIAAWGRIIFHCSYFSVSKFFSGRGGFVCEDFLIGRRFENPQLGGNVHHFYERTMIAFNALFRLTSKAASIFDILWTRSPSRTSIGRSSASEIVFLTLFLSFGRPFGFPDWPFLNRLATEFFGIDVLLLYWAFRLNYRHAEAYEQVTVTCSELKVRKVSHLGRAREWVLNPLWVKLDKSEIEDFGIDRLFLISRGKKLTIASFLSADEKADFARELGNALNEARRGPTRTVFDQPEIGWSGAPARPK
jgi:uncharacterized membrane protein